MSVVGCLEIFTQQSLAEPDAGTSTNNGNSRLAQRSRFSFDVGTARTTDGPVHLYGRAMKGNPKKLKRNK